MSFVPEKPAFRLPLSGYAICMAGICWREALRFLNQRGRFLSALVRPLVWLFIFAAGFRSVLGVSIIPPYETYVLYEVYVTPGLIAMIQLFNGLQSSLSMVYDREVGAMRILLVSPYPRWFLLVSKLTAGICVSILQVYAFLLVAWLWGVDLPPLGFLTVLPALGARRLHARRHGAADELRLQADGEFRQRDELRHLPDVLRLIGALPAVAGAGEQPGAVLYLHVQSVLLCGGADPLRALRPVRAVLGDGGGGLLVGIPRRLHPRL